MEIKVGDTVTMDPGCQPPSLYGVGLVLSIYSLELGEDKRCSRATIYWQANGKPRVGRCSTRHLLRWVK